MNTKSIIGIVAAVIIVGGVAIYAVKKGPSTVATDPNSTQAQAEMQALVVEIGKLIELPKGENPTVATITDPEKLKDQPFFANAKPGNKVLIYPTARKAFLYDPAAKRLVEVAPLILGNPGAIQNPASGSPVIKK